MTCDLTSGRLRQECQIGRAGIKTLYFVKYNDYASLTGIIESGGEITDLGADPLRIYQFNMESNVGNFDESANVAKENGTSYISQTVNLTLFYVKPADLATLNNLKKGRWVIWTLDFQDKIRIFGKTRGMITTGGSDVSGSAPGDKKGLDMTFVASENNYAPFMADYTTTPFDNFTNITVVTGDAFNPEYQAVYSAMTNKPSAAIAENQNTLVQALITAGIWNKLDIFYLFAQSVNTGGEALINWMNPGTFNATLAGTPNPTFVSLEGFTSDGTNGYIRTHYNPFSDGVNYLQNNASFGFYIRNNVSETKFDCGINAGTGSFTQLVARNAANTAQGRINNSNNDMVPASMDSTGMWVMARTASNARQLYRNGASLANDAVISSSIANLEMYVLGLNMSGVPSFMTIRQMSCFFMGSSLLLTDVQALTNAIETYMDSNSKGVIP